MYIVDMFGRATHARGGLLNQAPPFQKSQGQVRPRCSWGSRIFSKLNLNNSSLVKTWRAVDIRFITLYGIIAGSLSA